MMENNEVWIEWDGEGSCPVSPQTIVVAKDRAGKTLAPSPAHKLCWDHWNLETDIVEYRIISEGGTSSATVAPAAPVTVPDAAPSPDCREALAKNIYQFLNGHKLLNHTIRDSDLALPLVDLLTPEGDPTINRGMEENEAIAYGLAGLLQDYLRTPTQMTPEQRDGRVEGLEEDLRQLIRVALTNPTDLCGFIQANYPKEFAEFGQRPVLIPQFSIAARPRPAPIPECCVPEPGEPSFVLLGRDPQAPELVEKWADDRERYEPDSNKPAKAREIATAMRSYKAQHPDKGLPADAVQPQPVLDAVERAVVAMEEAKRILSDATEHLKGSLYAEALVHLGELHFAALALAHPAQRQATEPGLVIPKKCALREQMAEEMAKAACEELHGVPYEKLPYILRAPLLRAMDEALNRLDAESSTKGGGE